MKIALIFCVFIANNNEIKNTNIQKNILSIPIGIYLINNKERKIKK
jgi:hypothetical protein